MIIEKLDSC